MKRSQINQAIRDASNAFSLNCWSLPPKANWDVTDFGLGIFETKGLVLINLASEAEYCEKLMYAKKNQVTPEHYHKQKKEDIICRAGELTVILWKDLKETKSELITVQINGEVCKIESGKEVILKAGERITIYPYQWHKFYPTSDECIIGEVSTANDDLNDNFFWDDQIGRYPEILEDEPAILKLLSE